MTIRLTGHTSLMSQLADLGSPESAEKIAFRTAAAGVRVVKNACVAASPGRVKLEWGSVLYSRPSGAGALVGLGVGGYRVSVKHPHGIYLDKGTPHIPARHFGAAAVQASRSRALRAMKHAAMRTIQKIVSK